MIVLLALVLVVGVALGGVWLWRQTSHDVADEVDRFARARATTSRWAADPSSAPAPVLDIAERGARPVADEPDEGKGATRAR
jgi:hypothetical protein